MGRTARYGMVACAQLELDYGKYTTRVHKQNAFDLLLPAGLAFLALLIHFGYMRLIFQDVALYVT